MNQHRKSHSRLAVSRAALVLGALAMLTLAACQTVQGLGKDIQYAGEKTEEAIKN
jgi:predicted small secreted protein